MINDMEREQIIQELKYSIKIDRIKQNIYRLKYNLGGEIGCLTPEKLKIAMLFPRLESLNINYNDIVNEIENENIK